MKEIRTIYWDKNHVKIIDQNKLPHKLEYLQIRTYKQMIRAIKTMQIRGAPAIGIAGAFGMVLAAQQKVKLAKAAKEIIAARPTAVNLSWAVQKIQGSRVKGQEPNFESLLSEVQKMADEDVEINKKMGEHGSVLVKDGDNILSHCNAGALATVGYGTSLGVIRSAFRQGKKIHVYVSETRPRLQGARLTAWEMVQEKIPATLISDNMVGSLMRKGKIDLVIVGADRIAANGDTANKIGTYNAAVLAKAHNIPFYVAAPTSTIDPKIKSGKDIPIEERDHREVTNIGKERIAPKGIRAINPAFDVTPAEYITAIITENGIVRPPYAHHLR